MLVLYHILVALFTLHKLPLLQYVYVVMLLIFINVIV